MLFLGGFQPPRKSRAPCTPLLKNERLRLSNSSFWFHMVFGSRFLALGSGPWHTVGLQLAHSWHTVGSRLARGWLTVGSRLAHSWLTVGSRLAIGSRLAEKSNRPFTLEGPMSFHRKMVNHGGFDARVTGVQFLLPIPAHKIIQV